MANTYSQLYIHFVFAVQNRLALIDEQWEQKLHQYITGIVQQNKHKLMVINGTSDHLHLLVSMQPNQSPSELMYHIKRSSSHWINENRFCRGHFSWQEGFGCFSYGKSQVSALATYIEQQKEHHQKRPFREEYLALLQKFDVDYNEKYIFQMLE